MKQANITLSIVHQFLIRLPLCCEQKHVIVGITISHPFKSDSRLQIRDGNHDWIENVIEEAY